MKWAFIVNYTDHEISIEEIKKMNPKGIILSGGPNSVYEKGSFTIDPEIYNLGFKYLVFVTACN